VGFTLAAVVAQITRATLAALVVLAVAVLVQLTPIHKELLEQQTQVAVLVRLGIKAKMVLMAVREL
jgi:negative regulator of sigma E activity